MPLSQYDKDHMEEILIGGLGDWFTAQLLRLILKADNQNLSRLALGFPEEVAAVEAYKLFGPNLKGDQ
jgi:hypothetical protein